MQLGAGFHGAANAVLALAPSAVLLTPAGHRVAPGEFRAGVVSAGDEKHLPGGKGLTHRPRVQGACLHGRAGARWEPARARPPCCCLAHCPRSDAGSARAAPQRWARSLNLHTTARGSYANPALQVLQSHLWSARWGFTIIFPHRIWNF